MKKQSKLIPAGFLHSIVAAACLFVSAEGLCSVNPPTDGPCPPSPQGCEGPCGEEYPAGSPECDSTSFNFSLNLGYAPVDRSADLLHASRFGLQEGQIGRGYYRSFDEIRKLLFNPSNLTNKSMVYLRVNEPAISSALYDPSILQFSPALGVKHISGDNHLRQVYMDGSLTDIEKDANGNGFTIRVWSILAEPNKTGNFYDTPTDDPLMEIIFSNPEHPTLSNKLLVVKKQKIIGSAPLETATLYDQSVQDNEIITLYKGTNTSGTKLQETTMVFSDRGSRPWDYTFERTIKRANMVDGLIGPLVTVSKTQEIHRDFSLSSAGGDQNGKRIMSRTVSPGLPEAQTTTFDYYEDPANKYIHGRLKSVVKPDGQWEYYEYSDSDVNAVAVEKKYTPWKDTSIANYTQGLLSLTETEQTNSTTTVSLQGQQLSKMRYEVSQEEGTGNIIYSESMQQGSEWATTTTTFAPVQGETAAAGKPLSKVNADGTAETYEYIDSGSDTAVTILSGAWNGTAVNSGTKIVRIYNVNKILTYEQVSDILTGSLMYLKSGSEFDALQRPQKWTYNNNENDYQTQVYGCCGIAFTRDRSGATTEYFRDALKRVYRVIRKRSSGGVPIITTTNYEGLTTSVSTKSGAIELFVSETTRTLGGLTTIRKSPDANGDSTPETTTRVMAYNAGGGTTTTVTYPDNTTTSTITFTDGSLKSSTDQESHTTTYDKGTHAEQGGGLWRKTITPNTDQWTTTYSDHLGRAFKTQFSDGITETDGATSTVSYYNFAAAAGSRGKMASSTDPDGITTTYGYDAEGDRITVSQLSPNGGTRTTTTSHDVVDDAVSGIGIAARTTTTIEATGTAPQAAVTVSTSYRSTDGYQTKSVTLAGTTTSSRTVPVNGAWTVSATSADGQQTIQTYTDGLMEKTAMFDNQTTPVLIASTSQAYDAFGRTLTTTDSRTGVTTIGGYLENGAVTAVTTNGGADTTSYTYDVMGRRLITTLPDASVTHTRYTARGQTDATWGSQSYARAYTYDALGRMKTLRTKPTLDGSGAPTHTGGSITTWNYDTQRGWLTSKRDATNKGADYTYTAAGRLHTRTWARTGTNTTSGIVTTYTYSQGSLATVAYTNDPAGTPTVTYTYDAMGRPITVAQGTNTHTYLYDATTLVLDKETISYNGFTRTLDRSQDNLLRPSGFDLKNGTTTEHTASYTYDSASRLATVANGTDTFTYGYQANTYGLLKSVSRTGGHTVTNAYEASRNVLTEKNNHVNPVNPVSKFAYTTNNLGQRTGLTTSGTAFTTAPAYTWTYNAAGELTQADDTSAANNDRAYQFDAIGNREKTANGLLAALPSTDNYTANALNQYTAITGLPAGRSHDADGNMITGPLPVDQANNATLTWDAENRLVSVAPASGATIYYSYDYLSRRISKQIGATPATLYIYDGWNLITEYTGTTLAKSYTWGMDLSGSMQGAGGVGGLLTVNDGTATYYPTYDGNGNVSEYLDSSNVVQAHYEYDAFGNEIVAATSGSLANTFTHRFSTKPLDTETGLYYYGYRYYDPNVGRWPSRDPIGDIGGPTWFSAQEYFLKAVFRVRMEFYERLALLKESGFLVDSSAFEQVFQSWRAQFQMALNMSSEELGGYNLYGFAHNNSINSGDFLGLEVRCYASPAWGVELGAWHIFFYSDTDGVGGVGTAMISSGWTTGTGVPDDFDPSNTDLKSTPVHLPPGMTDQQFIDGVRKDSDLNQGIYFPPFNDCHCQAMNAAHRLRARVAKPRDRIEPKTPIKNLINDIETDDEVPSGKRPWKFGDLFGNDFPWDRVFG